MSLNDELKRKIEDLPRDYAYLANLLLNELEKGTKANTQIEQLIKDEIRDMVLEEME